MLDQCPLALWIACCHWRQFDYKTALYQLVQRQTKSAWIPQKVTYVAEDGFAMIGDELLSVLEKQIKKYKEMHKDLAVDK